MTSLTCMAWHNRTERSNFRAAIVLGFALAAAPTLALADAQVRGKPNAVTVEAKNATIEEILVALANAFDVHFRSSTNLERRLTGTYVGSLQQVVTQVLRGYDFFTRSGESGVEIILLGSSANAPDRPVPIPSSGGPVPTITPPAGPAPVPSISQSSSGPVPSLIPGPAGAAAPLPTSAGPGTVLPPVPGPSLRRVLPPIPGTPTFAPPAH
jgi:hypothetical protein